jgi:hypothetical protein
VDIRSHEASFWILTPNYSDDPRMSIDRTPGAPPSSAFA